MTLVVARVQNNKIYMLGDTELTFHNDQKANPFVEGCLKQYVVSDHLAVAFSGVREHFEQALSGLLRCQEGQQLADYTLQAQTGGAEFELLIAEVGYDKIRTVKNGAVYEGIASYIGSHSAFESFQRYYHEVSSGNYPQPDVNRASFQMARQPEPVLDNDIYPFLLPAFKQVIWDEQVTGVGGIIVPLCTDDGKFQYMNYVDITSDPLNVEDFRDQPKRIEFGTAAGGGYSVEFSDDSPRGGEGRNIGFYFLQGGFGVIFPSNDHGLRNAELVTARSPAAWVLGTEKKLGKGIASGYLNEDHCAVLGEEMLSAGKHEDALLCYELRSDSQYLENVVLGERPAAYDRYIAGWSTALFNVGRPYEAVTKLDNHIETHKHSEISQRMLSKMLPNKR